MASSQKIVLAPRSSLRDRIVLVLSCIFFLLLGSVLIPYPGVEDDEAIVGEPLYQPVYAVGSIGILGTKIPVMQMTYLGSLKPWLYAPIFRIWPPSVRSIRFPVLFGGMITIGLFWLLLKWSVGNRAAIVGVILLATDTIFLMTSCFDWGPVVLQHLLMVGGMLALIRFHQSGNEKALGLGFFLFGLGLWDKALFSWILGGLTLATLVVFPRELKKLLNWRRLIIAGTLFTLGAFPLLWYNVQQHGITFRTNTQFSIQNFQSKVAALNGTVDGSALFGYLVAQDPNNERPAKTAFERFTLWLNRTTGNHYHNHVEFAFLAAVLALPFLWRTPARKPMLFALVFLALVWTQMAVTVGAGTGAHHVVLLWPLPTFFIAVAFAELSKRIRSGTIVLAVTIAFLAGTNILVTNEYLKEFITYGPTRAWTDAISPLVEYLRPRTSNDIYTVDWGIFNQIRLLDRGTLKIQEMCFILNKESLNEADKSSLNNMLSSKDHLIVIHTRPFEAYKGVNARLAAIADKPEHKKELVTTIDDSHGRPVFEVLSFEEVHSSNK